MNVCDWDDGFSELFGLAFELKGRNGNWVRVTSTVWIPGNDCGGINVEGVIFIIFRGRLVVIEPVRIFVPCGNFELDAILKEKNTVNVVEPW